MGVVGNADSRGAIVVKQPVAELLSGVWPRELPFVTILVLTHYKVGYVNASFLDAFKIIKNILCFNFFAVFWINGLHVAHVIIWYLLMTGLAFLCITFMLLHFF